MSIPLIILKKSIDLGLNTQYHKISISTYNQNKHSVIHVNLKNRSVEFNCYYYIRIFFEINRKLKPIALLFQLFCSDLIYQYCCYFCTKLVKKSDGSSFRTGLSTNTCTQSVSGSENQYDTD